MDDYTRTSAGIDSIVTDASILSDDVRWERFGKFDGENGDHLDPQRHISTSCIFRARFEGISAP